MEEQWKDIPGYEGIYQASTYGRIRSIEGKTTQSTWHGERRWKERVLKPKGCADYRKIGYRVSLWKDKKPRDFLVARLVATTYLGDNIETSLTVNHKDGDRLNNRIENLEWLTVAGNIQHGFMNDLYPQSRTTLVDTETGESFIYRSMSLACTSIGRSIGYIGLCIKKGRVIKSKSGKRYSVKIERILSRF